MEAAPIPNLQENLKSPDYEVKVNRHGVVGTTFYIRIFQHRFLKMW